MRATDRVTCQCGRLNQNYSDSLQCIAAIVNMVLLTEIRFAYQQFSRPVCSWA
jgi:hypothetical protein